MLRKIITMCLVAISGVCMHHNEPKKSEVKTKKIMSIIDEYSVKIKTARNIEHRSYGFGSTGPDKVYDGKIHSLILGYSIDKNLKYDEARRLFYETVDGLIQAINSHPEIGDEFFHYPIGYQDLRVGLSFDYERKGSLKEDEIDQISIFENEIFYEVVNQESTPDEIEKKWILPNIYKTEGFGSKTHCIRKKLPETN